MSYVNTSVNLPDDMHRQAVMTAASLNSTVGDLIREALSVRLAYAMNDDPALAAYWRIKGSFEGNLEIRETVIA